MPIVARLMQWHFALILTFMPVLFGFVALYTRQQNFKAWLLLLSLVCGALIIINFLITPYSLRYSSLQPAPPLELPWGETMIRYTGTVSRWNAFARALFTLLFVWAFVRARILYQHGSQRSALFLTGALAYMLVASYVGLLVDLGYIRFIIPGGLSFFGLILITTLR
jgi:hypothetical protein